MQYDRLILLCNTIIQYNVIILFLNKKKLSNYYRKLCCAFWDKRKIMAFLLAFWSIIFCSAECARCEAHQFTQSIIATLSSIQKRFLFGFWETSLTFALCQQLNFFSKNVCETIGFQISKYFWDLFLGIKMLPIFI